MRFALICISLLGLPCRAEAAPPPSALVENVTGSNVGVEFLDYVSPGQRIQLGASGKIVLAYLDSCTRETITGGEVTIGTRSSQVKGGEIRRENPPCSSAAVALPNSNSEHAGAVFRSRPTAKRPTDPKRSSIYSLSPVFETGDHGTMVLERIDQSGERYEIVISPSSLVKGRFYDFAAANMRLKAGAKYAVSLGANRLIFEVDKSANASGPLLARLVRLTPLQKPQDAAKR